MYDAPEPLTTEAIAAQVAARLPMDVGDVWRLFVRQRQTQGRPVGALDARPIKRTVAWRWWTLTQLTGYTRRGRVRRLADSPDGPWEVIAPPRARVEGWDKAVPYTAEVSAQRRAADAAVGHDHMMKLAVRDHLGNLDAAGLWQAIERTARLAQNRTRNDPPAIPERDLARLMGEAERLTETAAERAVLVRRLLERLE